MKRRKKKLTRGRPHGIAIKLSGALAGRPEIEVSLKSASLLRVILRHVQKHSTPPSLRELAGAIDVSSTNTVRQHMAALVDAGLLIRHEHIRRGIVVTPLGKEMAGHWGLFQ